MNYTTPATTTRFETALPQDISITESGQIYTIPGNAFGALELYIELVSCDAYTDHVPGVITFFLRGDSIPEEYAYINFNDLSSSFIACFCLLMINNLNILVKSLTFHINSNKIVFQFYFATFYFFSTLIIINIIQTLLLELYLQ